MSKKKKISVTVGIPAYKRSLQAGIKNKISVTIGIPAYNEEANIKHLLESLLAQKETNFRLKEIIVLSDGSLDGTVKEAKGASDDRIKVIAGRERRGQALRQNQIFDKASGNFIVLLNADIILKSDNFLSEMVREYRGAKNADIVGAKTVPLTSKTPIGKVLGWHKAWKRRIYESINEAENIYLCHGRARGFSRKAYTAIRWPNGIWSEDAYSYLAAKKLGFRFIYCKQALVYYQPPENLKDQVRQSVRFLNSPKGLAPYFSKEELESAYSIPKKLLITSILKGLFKNPLKATAYLAIYLYCKVLATTTKPSDYHSWETSISTKVLQKNATQVK